MSYSIRKKAVWEWNHSTPGGGLADHSSGLSILHLVRHMTRFTYRVQNSVLHAESTHCLVLYSHYIDASSVPDSSVGSPLSDLLRTRLLDPSVLVRRENSFNVPHGRPITRPRLTGGSNTNSILKAYNVPPYTEMVNLAIRWSWVSPQIAVRLLLRLDSGVPK